MEQTAQIETGTRHSPLGVLLLITASVCGGSGLVLGRLAYDGGTNTTTVLLCRFFIASVALLVYFQSRGVRWRLAGKTLWQSLAVGAMLGVSSFLYYASVRHMPVSLAVIVVYTYPAMVGVLAHFWAHDRLTRRRIAALAVSFAGLTIALELSFAGLSTLGLVMALASAVAYAVTILLTSRLLRTVEATIVQLHLTLVNVALLALFGGLAGQLVLPVTPLGWAGMLGLSATFLIGFTAFVVGMRLVGPNRAAILNNLEPVVAIALGIVVLGESFGPWQIVGGGLVLAGVVLAQ